MQDMHVVAVGMDPHESQPVLLLQETAGQHRILPVWVGVPEATAIELERQHASSPRPMTHQLIGQVITSCGRRLEQVLITMVRENVFHAELILDGDTRVSSRVSDAVSIALHLDVPIRADDALLDEVGLAHAEVVDAAEGTDADADADESGRGEVDQADEVEQFRRFLDDASPEDFGKS